MTNEKPPVPTQASEAVDKGVELASGEDASPPAVTVTLTRAQAQALLWAAQWTFRHAPARDVSNYRSLTGAGGILRVALERR